MNPPPGFDPIFRRSPFTDLIGPVYSATVEGAVVLGLRIEEKHCNSRGTIHGGVLATLADITIGYGTAYSQTPPLALTTASLTLDYLGTAGIGDWIEARVDFHKIGSRLAFANAYVTREGVPILRASGVFARTGDG